VTALVDYPEEADVREIEGSNVKILEIRVSKQDVGKLIGKKGRNINAIRTIVAAAGKGRGHMVEVLGKDQHDHERRDLPYPRDRDTAWGPRGEEDDHRE
jgi:predicted RNA-binding protein YlqC (UPF0109 family)